MSSRGLLVLSLGVACLLVRPVFGVTARFQAEDSKQGSATTYVVASEKDNEKSSHSMVSRASLSESEEACPSCEPIVECPCDDQTCSAWMVGFDYLNWQPHQRGMDFAATEDGTAQTIGVGEVHNLELERHSGYRGTVGYQTSTGWMLSFRGTSFETQGSSTIVRPGGVGELFATRSHPDTNEEADIISAASNLDYRFFELEGSRAIFQNRFADIRIFGGAVFTDIRQSMRMDLDGRDFLQGVITNGMTMDGFGFQFGSTGEWRMAKGFGLFGRVAAGLMHGRFHTNLFESNRFGQDIVVRMSDRYEQAVPKLDASGGLSWTRGGFQAAVGYDMTNLFQIVNRTQFIDDIHEGLYGPFETDLLLEGMFARVTATW